MSVAGQARLWTLGRFPWEESCSADPDQAAGQAPGQAPRSFLSLCGRYAHWPEHASYNINNYVVINMLELRWEHGKT